MNPDLKTHFFALQSEAIPKEGESKATVETEKRDWPWKKAKKVAVMISFCGKDYLGMQR